MQFQTRKSLEIGYDEALAQLPAALKTEGFGILTEIDVQDTLRKKLGTEFRRYKILGACNPELAHRALQTELEIGLMLPCNVIVYEADDGKTAVSAIDPTQTVGVANNPRLLTELATTVRDKLARATLRLPERQRRGDVRLDPAPVRAAGRHARIRRPRLSARGPRGALGNHVTPHVKSMPA